MPPVPTPLSSSAGHFVPAGLDGFPSGLVDRPALFHRRTKDALGLCAWWWFPGKCGWTWASVVAFLHLQSLEAEAGGSTSVSQGKKGNTVG